MMGLLVTAGVFYCADNRVHIDCQYSSGVFEPGTLHRHIDNFFFSAGADGRYSGS